MQRTTRNLLGACTVGLLLLTGAPLASAHFTNSYGSQVSAALGPSIIGAENCRYGDDEAVPLINANGILTQYAAYLAAGGAGTPDNGNGACGPSGGNWLNNGVSGNYVLSTDAVLYSDFFPIFAGPVTIGPAGAIAAGGIGECDLELLSPAQVGFPTDESKIDSAANPGGLVLDGTIDDGGIGAACHVRYSDPITGNPVTDFTTTGCPGYAHANDKLLNGEVFISAECDYGHNVGTGDAVGTVFSAVFCGINIPTGGCTTGEELAILGSIQNPPPTTFECGGDAVNDAANYGEGNAEAPGQGVPYPVIPSPCTSGDAVASAFVHSAADVEGNLFGPDGNVLNLQSPPVESQLPAISGWIDWSATCSYGVQLAIESPSLPSPPDVKATTGFGEVDSCPADPLLDGDNGSTPPICAAAGNTVNGGATFTVTHTWPCVQPCTPVNVVAVLVTQPVTQGAAGTSASATGSVVCSGGGGATATATTPGAGGVFAAAGAGAAQGAGTGAKSCVLNSVGTTGAGLIASAYVQCI